MNTDTDPKTAYYFLPSLRQGLLPATGPDQEGRAALEVSLKVLGTKESGEQAELSDLALPEMKLYGPGDVLGFHPRIVLRTDPKPDTGTFEANYFPAIEFADADFVWRYSPRRDYSQTGTLSLHDDGGNATPWITLIVLVQESWNNEVSREFEERPNADSNLPPRISVNSVQHLPDLNHAKYWAHVQITRQAGGVVNKDSAKEYVEEGICRLLCARRLAPKTKYAAFVVPTFELGRKAGLGEEVAEGTPPDQFAWEIAGTSPIVLPYYYRWEFITSQFGDFEYLLRLLEARELKGLGLRPMDCSKTFEKGNFKDFQLGLEGALKSVDTAFTPWGRDANELAPTLEPFQIALSEELSESTKPVVTPPLYGQWPYEHRLTTYLGISVSYQKPDSLIPRGLIGKLQEVGGNALPGRKIKIAGTQQETLTDTNGGFSFSIPTSWTVLVIVVSGRDGKEMRIEVEVNSHQLVILTEGMKCDDNWFNTLNLDPRHRAAAALGSQVVRKQQESLMASAWEQLGSAEVNEVFALAQAGVTASTRYYQRLNKVSSPWVQNRLAYPLLRKTKPEAGIKTFASGAQPPTVTKQLKAEYPWMSVDPAFQRVTRPGGPLSRAAGNKKLNDLEELSSLTEQVAFVSPPRPFGGKISEISAKLAQPGSAESSNTFLKASVREENYLAKYDPTETIPKRVLNRVNSSIPALANRTEKENLNPFVFVPQFPAPLYEYLRELGHEYILPGVEKVPQNTIGVLETNRRFIESFLCGCNHEFAGELLWREYPADLRGTFFRQFWDTRGRMPQADKMLVHQNWLQKQKKRAKALNQDWEKRKVQLMKQKLLEYMDAPAYDLLFKEGNCDNVFSQIQTQEAHQETCFDIKKLKDWGQNALGENFVSEPGNLVLLIRGDLLRRYPNTVIYAVDAVEAADGTLVPALPGYTALFKIEEKLKKSDSKPRIANTIKKAFTDNGIILNASFSIKERISKQYGSIWEVLGESTGQSYVILDDLVLTKQGFENLSEPEFPFFEAKLPPDITFFGFTFQKEAVWDQGKSGTPASNRGKFFIFEEPVGGARFGLDPERKSGENKANWDNLSWTDFGFEEGDKNYGFVNEMSETDNQELYDVWNNEKSSALKAGRTFQKPVRIAVHGDQMIY